MSKTKTLVLAVSVLTSLAGIGVSAGTAQAREDLASVTAGDLNAALDRAEYTGFRGGFGRGFGGFRKFHFHRFDRFDRFDRFGRGGREFGRGRF
jgi:hypothetical protein